MSMSDQDGSSWTTGWMTGHSTPARETLTPEQEKFYLASQWQLMWWKFGRAVTSSPWSEGRDPRAVLHICSAE